MKAEGGASLPVIGTVGIPVGATVVDIGFRRAARLLEIKSIVGERGTVCGVEVDRAALRETSRELGDAENICVLGGDTTRLPLAAHIGDVILFRGVLHEIRDVKKALLEARRICRPTGFIVIVDFAAFPYRWHLMANLRWRLRHRTVFGAPPDKHPGFKWATLQRLLRDAGFAAVDFRPSVGLSHHTGHDIPVFMAKAVPKCE